MQLFSSEQVTQLAQQVVPPEERAVRHSSSATGTAVVYSNEHAARGSSI